jgi:hypothetical protein
VGVALQIQDHRNPEGFASQRNEANFEASSALIALLACAGRAQAGFDSPHVQSISSGDSTWFFASTVWQFFKPQAKRSVNVDPEQDPYVRIRQR